jgi:superfamily II DNA helicase RecQ
VPVTPTVPRRPFLHERWRDIETAAAKLSLTLDTTTRKIVRSILENGSTLSTALRTESHVLAGLVAAQLLPQVSLVVSLDAAWLADHRDRVERAGASTVLLDEAKGDVQPAAVLERIANGAVKVVLTTPKWLSRDAVLRAIGKVGLGVVIVTEAHRASTFSHAFSPVQARLGSHLERLGRPPVFALAPGASSAVSHDVVAALLPHPPDTVDGPAVRPNVALSFAAGRGEVRQRALVEAVRKLQRPMLVLCGSPRDVDAVHGALRSLGLPAHRYHEEMRAGARAGEQLQFSMPGERAILVATSAFAVGAGAQAEDAEGVPLRYGRRATKTDVRSLVRFGPPASLEQLVDELSLVARDGQAGEAIVFCDGSDRPVLEAELESSRPTGEQLLMLGRALEGAPAGGAPVTTESLALGAGISRRAVETLSAHLDGMGLVSSQGGWLRRLAPEHVLLRELRALAERFATVRALDARRLSDVGELAAHSGCKAQRMRRLLGEADASSCGACPACAGTAQEGASDWGGRRPPARRFTLSTEGASDEARSGTFHTDRSSRPSVLTAKIADFR